MPYIRLHFGNCQRLSFFCSILSCGILFGTLKRTNKNRNFRTKTDGKTNYFGRMRLEIRLREYSYE